MSNSLTIYGLDQDVNRWVDSMSATPTITFITNLNTMVSKLKAAAVWDQLDRFWLFATENRQHAQVCIKSLSAVTEVSSPTWTANQGFSGNGTSAYLNSNYNPTSNGYNFSRNNGSLGIYSLTNLNQSSWDMGLLDSSSYTGIVPRGLDMVYSIANETGAFNGTTNTDSRGFYSGVRLDSTSCKSWKNGNNIYSESNTAPILANRNIYILGLNSNGVATSFSSRQLSMSFIGGSEINQSKFYQIFQEFATKQGFNV